MGSQLFYHHKYHYLLVWILNFFSDKVQVITEEKNKKRKIIYRFSSEKSFFNTLLLLLSHEVGCVSILKAQIIKILANDDKRPKSHLLQHNNGRTLST